MSLYLDEHGEPRLPMAFVWWYLGLEGSRFDLELVLHRGEPEFRMWTSHARGTSTAAVRVATEYHRELLAVHALHAVLPHALAGKHQEATTWTA